MASLWHCYNYIRSAICCCKSDNDEEVSRLDDIIHEKPADVVECSEKQPSTMEATVAYPHQDMLRHELHIPVRSFTSPQPVSISPRSLPISTPDSSNRMPRKDKLRSLAVDDGTDSLVSEDAPSDFSHLARRQTSPQENGKMLNGTPRRTLGTMSIAKLTSGVADGNASSR